jgi:acetyl-CoA carboxylase biotin carboxyl carrier protein
MDSMAERSVRKKSSVAPGGADEPISLTVGDIKELFELMKANRIAELNLEHKGTKIHIVGEHAPVASHPVVPVMPGVQPMGLVGVPPASVGSAGAVTHNSSPPVDATPAPPPAGAAESANIKTILSPMVGTFYRSSAPDADPFVEVGDHVDEDTVLCIIEAMKIMNEIKAEVGGRVHKILVENGHPVEYNQPLFQIEI